MVYNASGEYKKAMEINDRILKEHPDYLFGLVNKAHQLIRDEKPEKVPGILGNNLDLRALYPKFKGTTPAPVAAERNLKSVA